MVNNIREKTTTSDQILINKLKMAVKRQVGYDSKPGAANEIVFYTVKVQPKNKNLPPEDLFGY